MTDSACSTFKEPVLPVLGHSGLVWTVRTVLVLAPTHWYSPSLLRIIEQNLRQSMVLAKRIAQRVKSTMQVSMTRPKRQVFGLNNFTGSSPFSCGLDALD